MKNKEENHLMKLSNDLIEIRQQLNYPQITSEELKSCLKKLKKRLNIHFAEQVVGLIEAQIKESFDREEKLDEAILPVIDKKIQELQCANDSRVIISLKKLYPPNGFPMTVVDWRVQMLRNKIIELRGKSIDFIIHNFYYMTNDDELNKILNTPELVEWRAERYDRSLKLELLRDVKKISDFDSKSEFYNKKVETWKSIADNICSSFIDTLSKTNELAFIKIKKISYSFTYNKDTGKARLKITINDEKSKVFTGGKRPQKAFKVIEESLAISEESSGVTIEELNSNQKADKKTYDREWNHFNAMNRQLIIAFSEYGYTSFFVSDEDGGYTIKVCDKYRRILHKDD